MVQLFRLLSIRFICLSSFCIHYSFLTIILHVSRTSSDSKTSYKPSSAVLITELLKLSISVLISVWEITSADRSNKPSDDKSGRPELNPDQSPSLKLQTLETIDDNEEEEDENDEEGEDHEDENEAGSSNESEEGWDEKSDRLVSNVMDDIRAQRNPHQEKFESFEEADDEMTEPNHDEDDYNYDEQRQKSGRRRRRTVSDTTLDHIRTTSTSYRLSVRSSPPSKNQNRKSEIGKKNEARFSWLDELCGKVFSPGWWKLCVPSVMFVAQNNLQYIAASNLSVPLLQITYQLKILTTALCSVFLLKRKLYRIQWIALVLLTIGVATVQLHTQTDGQAHSENSADINESGLTDEELELLEPEKIKFIPIKKMNRFLGLTAVIAACLSSGFSTVYFEKVLKSDTEAKKRTENRTISNNDGSDHNSLSSSSSSSKRKSTGLIKTTQSIWTRNIQLSLFGLMISFMVLLIETNKPNWDNKALQNSTFYSHQDNKDIVNDRDEEGLDGGEDFLKRFFVGFTPLVWLVIVFQVIGGFLNGLVIKYSDNILKGFATSISILISIVMSMILFEFEINFGIFFGGTLVLISTWMFNLKPKK